MGKLDSKMLMLYSFCNVKLTKDKDIKFDDN